MRLEKASQIHSEKHFKVTMSSIKRVVETAPNGYKEVSLQFRKARAEAHEKAQLHERTERIPCPMIDAARTKGSYGKCPMATTDIEGMTEFSNALKIDPWKFKTIGLLSGPACKIPGNIYNGRFNEKEINIGVVRKLKYGVHTGVIGEGKFDQDKLNGLVWHLYPHMEGIAIDREFLMDPNNTTKADSLYLTENNVAAILEWNHSQTDSYKNGKQNFVSGLEMKTLLLAKMGQQIQMDSEDKSNTVSALSVRDFHDLYKYGIFPAPLEDKFLELGFIKESCLALTLTPTE